jgi:asparagine synthase (glutamine-hydrolysing)
LCANFTKDTDVCGIAGAVGHFSKLEADQIVQSMVNSLRHRGPDDQGVCTLTPGPHAVSLGNARLSILDPSSAGHQPMTEQSGRYWIAFNGEIYNFQELRKMLDAGNRIFRTSTDTETILHAFHRWSLKSFGMLRGMFAFALFDTETRLLYLARDPLGIKPLYYYFEGQRLYFASEVRALLASGRIPRRTHPESVAHFLSCGWIGKSETAISGVELLQPGQLLTVDLGGEQMKWRVSTYERAWSSEPALPKSDRNEAVAHLNHLLEQSVKSHLISDVPVGLFLSGGIDSTAILQLMSRMGTGTPKTFTVGFPEEDFNECHHAKRVAQRYGADHHELKLSESTLLADLPAALGAMDQPTMDGINSFVISKAVRAAGVKVALSGIGADELFAGYPSFRRARLASRVAGIPLPVRSTLAAVGRSVLSAPRFSKIWDLLNSDCTPASAYRISRRLFEWREIAVLVPEWRRRPEWPDAPFSGDEVNEISQLEMSGYMTGLLLRDTDFMSMASSLEVRVPFVDKVLVQHVLRLPGRWKLGRSAPKTLLLNAMRGTIPEYVWNRRKMGFVLPFDRWMRSVFRGPIEATFGDRRLARAIGLSSPALEEVWRRFLNGAARWSQPWSLFVLLRWCDRYGVSL